MRRRGNAAGLDRADLLGMVAGYVDQFGEPDTTSILMPSAATYAGQLTELLLADEVEDLDAWWMLGMFHWCRFVGFQQRDLLAREQARAGQATVDGDGEAGRALDETVDAFAHCFIAGRADVPEPLLTVVAEGCVGQVLDLHDQAELCGDVELITRVLRLWQRMFAAYPPGDPTRYTFAFAAGTCLAARFGRTGDRGDLDDGIAAMRTAMRSLPPDHDGLPAMLLTLGSALEFRFEQASDVADLDEALAFAEQSVALSPAADPDLDVCRTMLSWYRVMRAQMAGEPPDPIVIAAMSAAVQAIPVGHAQRPWCEVQLSTVLVDRFERAGDLNDLAQAIILARAATGALSDEHPHRLLSLANLSAMLLRRHERVGALADLEESIAVAGHAVRLAGPGHPTRPACLGELGLALLARFRLGGDEADLDGAVQAIQQAIEVAPAGHARHPRLVSGLCVTLLTRYQLAGRMADLEMAIEAGRAAASAAQPGQPDLSAQLAIFGFALLTRFERTGDGRDLDDAIAASRRANDVVPDGHFTKSALQSNLAGILRGRSDLAGHAADLNEAILLAGQAVDGLLADSPHRGQCLLVLGSCLVTRFDRSGAEADLAQAIDVLRQAVAATGAQHQGRAQAQAQLGAALTRRLERTGLAADAEAAIDAYEQAARAASAPVSARIRAAEVGAEVGASRDPARAARLLDLAVRLLPQVAPRVLGRSDQQHALSQFAGLASDAAALTLAAGGPSAAGRAVGLLELGRAVLHGQALDTRIDLIELLASHPELGAQFLRLRAELDAPDDVGGPAIGLPVSPVGAGSGQGRLGRERGAVAAEFAALLDQIRRQDGFDSFLLPPQPDQLVRQAKQGPIVVFNVSSYRSDALLITPAGITSVELAMCGFDELTSKLNVFEETLRALISSPMSLQQRSSAQRTLNDILEWLWDVAAEPVLTQLGYCQPPGDERSWPRVWWVPAGMLSMLPLHAAGYHHRPDDDRAVMARVISSYTPTVRALAHARERAATTSPRRSLIVAMPTTPGRAPLGNASAEAEVLRTRLPAPTVLIESPGPVSEATPTKAAVLARLAEAGIAHFACHAASHPGDPSRSQLYLHDHDADPFTVASLLPVRLNGPQLAYLSACQTARNAAEGLLDEAIHLTSAFQLAGYPHVVGTLWEIDDRVAVSVADTFYSHLQVGAQAFDVTAAARALHETILAVKASFADLPSLWAAYMHAGA